MTKYLLDKKQGTESKTCRLLCLKQSLNCRVTVTFVLYLFPQKSGLLIYILKWLRKDGWRMVEVL